MATTSISFFSRLQVRPSTGAELTWPEKIKDSAERYFWTLPYQAKFISDAPEINGVRPAIFFVTVESQWLPLKIASYCFGFFHCAYSRLFPKHTQFWVVRCVLWVGTLLPVAAALVKLWHRRNVGEYYVYTNSVKRKIDANDRARVDQVLGLKYGLIDGLEPREIERSEFENEKYEVKAPIEHFHVRRDDAQEAYKNCVAIYLTRSDTKIGARVVIHGEGGNWMQWMANSNSGPTFFNNNTCILNGRLSQNVRDEITRLQTLLRDGKGKDMQGVEWTFDKAAGSR